MNQKTKSILGWLSIFAISLIPVFLFFAFGSGLSGFQTFSYSLYTLGRIFALVGVTLFALNFVLSTRLRFLEEIFGGMDKVYLVHGIVGGTAFMLILAHPLFIVANFIPNSIVKAASYFIPGSILSLDFGLIAIIGLISLMVITFFTRMKYNHWKFTHEFMGLVFAFSALHMLLVRDSVAVDNIFYGYYPFISLVIVIGTGAFIYSLIVRKKFLRYAQYKIAGIQTSKDLIELDLEPVGKPILYKSGQFIFARFYSENVSKEPHPFSIASKSNSRVIKIIIKKSGDFTNLLETIKEGDKVTLEGPYGRFNLRNFENKNQVWIAAGIGISPFLGMIEELKENPDYRVELFYTFSENKIINQHYLKIIQETENLRFVPWNSRKRGHLKLKDITNSDMNLKDKEILICGPLAFKEEMIKRLKELRINKNKIHEEVFELK